MTNETNVKRAQVTLLVLGRVDKIRICRMRPDIRNAKAGNAMVNVPAGATLKQGIIKHIVSEIETCSNFFAKQGRPVNIEVFTVGQLAIKYRQLVPYLKGGNFVTPEQIEFTCLRKDGTPTNDTPADKMAYAELANCIAKTIKAGNAVHLQASGNAAFFELQIPEGVAMPEDGTLLNFENGVAENGIQAYGWRNANRKGAKVIVRGTRYPRAYITKAEDPENPWRGLKTLLDTIDACWNDLPAPETDKSKDDMDLEELYSA